MLTPFGVLDKGIVPGAVLLFDANPAPNLRIPVRDARCPLTLLDRSTIRAFVIAWRGVSLTAVNILDHIFSSGAAVSPPESNPEGKASPGPKGFEEDDFELEGFGVVADFSFWSISGL